VERLLQRAMEVAEQAEVFSVSSRRVTIHFEANRLREIQTRESVNVALRIFKDGRVGFARASGFVDEDSLLEMAVQTSQFGPLAKYQFPGLDNYPAVDVFDPAVEKVEMSEMVNMGSNIVTAITEHTADILCDASVVKGVSSIQILNSQGGRANYGKSFFGLDLEGTLVRNEDMLFVGESTGSCCLPIGIDGLVDSVKRQLEWAKDLAELPARTLPVIFTPTGVVEALLSPLVKAFSGKMVLEGASPLKGRLGERIFDTKFSLRDDATVSCGSGSRPCDDEGVRSQSLSLISDGEVANFFYDLKTAALVGIQSTGHGERIGAGFPQPASSSLIVAEGEIAFEDMVADMTEGLIVEQVMGADQGNLLSGDFSGNVLLGYMVENGRIIGRVKNTMISGNVYQILKNIPGIGNKAQWVNGLVYTPYLYCSGVSIASGKRNGG
jgi:PmbA protein